MSRVLVKDWLLIAKGKHTYMLVLNGLVDFVMGGGDMLMLGAPLTVLASSITKSLGGADFAFLFFFRWSHKATKAIATTPTSPPTTPPAMVPALEERDAPPESELAFDVGVGLSELGMLLVAEGGAMVSDGV